MISVIRFASMPRHFASVSLNPVTTELLYAIEAGPTLVGRTSWDLYPEAAKAVTDVGNGMGPNVEAVLGRRPISSCSTRASRIVSRRGNCAPPA